MQVFLTYWTGDELITNGLILLHLFGALAVGMALGYERSYHGRAAGMRTYALVCVASTLLSVLSSFPKEWYGGTASMLPGLGDPTRIIQGVMTGIGFLGAGMIMKEGATIRGLSTAALVWVTAAIGIAIGIGFYGAAIGALIICLIIMSGFRRLEVWLPHETEVHVSLTMSHKGAPGLRELEARVLRHRMVLTAWTYRHGPADTPVIYDLTVRTTHKQSAEALVKDLAGSADILDFTVSPMRS